MHCARVDSGKLAPYLFGGAALWVALLDAGISPTLAGVVLGLALPLELGKRVGRALHYPVAFGVVPLFVFANSGITFGMLDWRAVGDWVSIGIMLGLVAGKPLGIFMAAFAFIKLGFARLPTGCGWLHLCAVAAMAGVGFTMSLFIASLAFGSDERMVSAQIGVILGSLASAAIGTICMAHVLHKKEKSVL